MNDFAKFEKFLPHSVIMLSFMTVGSQMSELDWGDFFAPPPCKIGSQNTPCKLGLNDSITDLNERSTIKAHISRTVRDTQMTQCRLGDTNVFFSCPK